MGACRHACCDGWPVNISLHDYYRLVGEDCSKDLRRRIDGALHINEHPTDDDYAMITPNFYGECPMRLEDGRCALHAELGEDALSAVCRLYPRGVRSEGDLECSCANSCEAVIETFMRHPEPLGFIKAELSIEPPEAHERSVFFETVGREQEIRLYFIRILQNRPAPLPARLTQLGKAIYLMQQCLKRKDAGGVDALLSSPLPAPEALSHDHTHAEFLEALDMTERLGAYIDEHSRSIHDYGTAALEYFKSGKNALDNYRAALETLEKVVPDWETVFEHMLVNHCFFERFPFQDRPESIHDEFAALCFIYILLRFLCLGWVALNPERSAFADVCAAAFRFFDHTSFDRHAARIMQKLGCSTQEDVVKLMLL